MFHPSRWAFVVCAIVLSSLKLLAVEPIELHLDASDAPRKRLEAHLGIPAKAGPLTLYYPKWIAGEHAPSGPVTDLTGIKIRAGGKTIPWNRDEEDTYAIHLTVPKGATTIEVDLEYIASPVSQGFSAAASITPKLAVLNWNHVLLYPKGAAVQDVKVVPSVTIPAGWKMGCAMPIASEKNGKVTFETCTLERLCDSPILCGKYYKEVPIGPKDGGPPHFLCLIADSDEVLKLSPELKTNYDRLVAEAQAMFGARHYRSYRFLLTLSDHVAHFGLEHHECNDSRGPARMLVDPLYRKTWHAWLLSHEYVHSWNGKHRRPAGMVVDDFQKAERTKMLWVYEGLTQYLGLVLAARSGLWTPEVSRDNFAHVADWAKNQTGRDWRSLEDTAIAAQHLYGSRNDGKARRRGVDFYDEGALIWLDADTLIREKTNGEKSIDNFCQAFFGGADGPPMVKPYEFEDIVKALNGVVEYDWRTFFKKRVMQAGAEPPLDGLKRGGWKLIYAPARSEGQEYLESESRTIDLSSSLGLQIKDDGVIVDVIPLKPADKAGVAAGMKLLAVNGRRWSAEGLRNAIAAAKDDKERKGKIEMLFENSDLFETIAIMYSDGEKYPKLEQLSKTRDLLGDILRPKTPIEGPR
jgi:predicted metalloprotease with PDZ domain